MRSAIASLLVAACAASPAPSTTADSNPTSQGFVTVRDRAGVLDALRSAGDGPVLLDLTAQWCMPCVDLANQTFVDPRVVARLADHRWIAVDVSDGTDEQIALQAFFGGHALPRVVVWPSAAPVLAALQRGEMSAPVGTLELATFVTADELLAAIDAPR
jgi:thiol:disulfide interchange protein DsbD